MIAVNGVSKNYGSVTAVDDLTFTVDRGEVVGFLGPNGAGKTTTMRMITGTLQPDKGEVLFDGIPITKDLTEAKRRVGYLPEANPLYDEMLVADYLQHVADLRGLSLEDTRMGIGSAVEETALGSVFYRPVGECSKGYRQRIGLAAAILHRPEVLILDEPTEGLDPNQRVEIRRLVANLGRERTVLLSTHVMQEVEATCSRLVILSRGALAAIGSVQDLLANQSGAARYIIEAQGSGITETLSGMSGVSGHTVQEVEGRVRVTLEAITEEDLRPKIFSVARDNNWMLWELHRERASLEQVFRDLTSEGLKEENPQLVASQKDSEVEGDS
ncbi:MAG: ATP-binding cassette domain-containing protein [Gemmatimonadota bacterium]|jgi:ABC-2 type transport system ATP-binding protein|nr:ATP-binding cassette domain-containing protein [Gemmatimonadota bacterium]MEC9317881.1 ATP-binding cassette domain-containing protein [Gemmatimonadota bacterium]|tara:strand:+ start:2014 stop:3000 length:987 start_codon:yes stop_codon:yes gene_type:complete